MSCDQYIFKILPLFFFSLFLLFLFLPSWFPCLGLVTILRTLAPRPCFPGLPSPCVSSSIRGLLKLFCHLDVLTSLINGKLFTEFFSVPTLFKEVSTWHCWVPSLFMFSYFIQAPIIPYRDGTVMVSLLLSSLWFSTP